MIPKYIVNNKVLILELLYYFKFYVRLGLQYKSNKPHYIYFVLSHIGTQGLYDKHLSKIGQEKAGRRCGHDELLRGNKANFYKYLAKCVQCIPRFSLQKCCLRDKR